MLLAGKSPFSRERGRAMVPELTEGTTDARNDFAVGA